MIEQKVAVVTGASRGIGAGLVEGYRKHGYAEIDTYPDEEWDSGFTTVLLVKALAG